MPTSKETRVRVDGFEKISAQVWPTSGCGPMWARFFFSSVVARRTARISSRENCSMLRRCFMKDQGPLLTTGDPVCHVERSRHIFYPYCSSLRSQSKRFFDLARNDKKAHVRAGQQIQRFGLEDRSHQPFNLSTFQPFNPST